MVQWLNKQQVLRLIASRSFTSFWLEDNEKGYFGTSKDVSMYFDGTSFYIASESTPTDRLFRIDSDYVTSAKDMVYFVNTAQTNSGSIVALRARAQQNHASASGGEARGVYGQGIAVASKFAGTITGVQAAAIAKNASTVTTIRGLFAEGETEATPTAVTNLYGAYIRQKSHVAISGEHYNLMLDNEKMATGIIADAFIGMKATTWASACATYGIDLTGPTYSNGALCMSDKKIYLGAGTSLYVNEAGTNFMTFNRSASIYATDATSGTGWTFNLNTVTTGVGYQVLAKKVSSGGAFIVYVDSDELSGGDAIRVTGGAASDKQWFSIIKNTSDTEGCQVIVDGSNAAGAAAKPSLRIGTFEDGFYLLGAGRLGVATNGVARFHFDAAHFRAATSSGPELENSGSSATNPTLIPDRTELGTGIGGTADAGSLIALSLEALKFAKVSGNDQPAIYFPEITTPTAIANMHSVYAKSDDILYHQDGAGNETALAEFDTDHAEMYWNGNTNAITPVATFPIATVNLTTGDLNDWTFVSSGLTGAITDTEDNSGTLRCTDVAHGLVTGDVVVLHGMGDTAHNGVTSITKITNDVFDCDDITYNSIDDTGSWTEPDYVQAGANTDGDYVLAYQASVTKGAGGSATVSFCLYVDGTQQTKTISEREFAGTDEGSVGGHGIGAIVAGDRVFMTFISSNTDTITFKYGNIFLKRI